VGPRRPRHLSVRRRDSRRPAAHNLASGGHSRNLRSAVGGRRAVRGESNHQLGFRALVRTSARMAAYRRISARIFDHGRLQRHREIPANEPIRCQLASETGLIAMQKVEGSNPFSRFFVNPLQMATLAFGENREIQSNRPLLRPPFWARVPKMTPIRGEWRRFRPIPPRFRAAPEPLVRPFIHDGLGP
jgi:hypothetical protein